MIRVPLWDPPVAISKLAPRYKVSSAVNIIANLSQDPHGIVHGGFRVLLILEVWDFVQEYEYRV